MTVYFGPRWDAPALDNAIEAETPVGKACYRCEQLIVRGDRGYIEPSLTRPNDSDAVAVTQVHAECRLDEFCGHNVGLCHHTGHELSRDRAWAVWARFFDEEGHSLWAKPETP